MTFVKSLNDSLALIWDVLVWRVRPLLRLVSMAEGVCCLGMGEDMFAVVMCYNLHLSNCMWIKGGGVGGDVIWLWVSYIVISQ